MGKFFTICLAVFVATGSFLFGYDSGVMTNGAFTIPKGQNNAVG